jgi:hypothetical protein
MGPFAKRESMSRWNTFAILVLGTHLLAGAAPAQQKWWLEKPLRLIQTNLREIDARDFDVEVYVSKAKEFSANTVLINVGGIVANYPTELEYHYRNPYLKFDMIGEVVKRLHEEGIRVIGRFDFSKINEKFAARHPEWLYKGVNGEFVNYNGQVHTCVNGGYQQKYLFKILGEAIDRYPLDGIFFNMIGYQMRDYSYNYHGICQSDACRRRFHEWSGGLSLPLKEDMDDPVFRKYEEFRRETSDELFLRVNEFIKSKRKDIAICTYTDAGVDLIRSESGSDLRDGVPAWNYHSTDNVKRGLGSFRDKQAANTAVHFVDIPFRHSSVSAHLTGMRLIEDMLSGGALDYYLIGRLDNQDDRVALRTVRDIFRFHKENERWFTGLRSPAPVLLVHGEGQATSEYRGFIRILAAGHIVFDVMDSERLTSNDTPRPFEDYQLVILPDVANLSDAACQRLDDYVAAGGAVLTTGETSTHGEHGNPLNRFRLQAAGVEPEYKIHERMPGTYFRIFPKDKETLNNPSFEDLDIVYVLGDFLEYKLRPGAKGYLGLVPAAMYGPPEKCYYTDVTHIQGLIANHYGKGMFAYFPWPIGRHYDYRSNHGHRMLVMAVIRNLLGLQQDVVVDASPLVEVFHQESPGGTFGWIGLANHSGQLGTAFHLPLPIRDSRIRFRPPKPVKSVRVLKENKSLEFASEAGGWVRFTVPELNAFEVVLAEYK